MNYRFAAILLASSCLVTPALAEPGRIPNSKGNFYFSIEGGAQKKDGSSVAAYGNISATDDYNPDSAAAAGVLARPEFSRSIRVNESPSADQINDEESLGGSVSINASSTTDNSHARTSVAADAIGFLDAFADVWSDSSNEDATAEAFGGPFIQAENGGYVGLTLGYGFKQPFYGIFDRIELYGTVSSAEENDRFDGAAAAISVDGTSAFATAVITPDGFTPTQQDFGAIATNVDQTVKHGEIGLRLKADRWNYNSLLLTAGLESFYVAYRQDTSMHATVGGAVGNWIGSDFRRNADVDGNSVGVMPSLEGQLPIEGTALSLVGRTFAGFYYLNADGAFTDNFGVRDIHDNLSKWGYRVGVEGGVRFDITQSTFFSVTGTIDHFSDMPTATLPRNINQVSSVDSDSMTNYKVGGRLTFVVGDQPAPLK
jgi:hypothetical protein